MRRRLCLIRQHHDVPGTLHSCLLINHLWRPKNVACGMVLGTHWRRWHWRAHLDGPYLEDLKERLACPCAFPLTTEAKLLPSLQGLMSKSMAPVSCFNMSHSVSSTLLPVKGHQGGRISPIITFQRLSQEFQRDISQDLLKDGLFRC